MSTRVSAHTAVSADNAVFLEHYPDHGGPPERIPIGVFPFTIGRAESNHYRVVSGVVSKHHAVLVNAGGRYGLCDLKSTNGTFVNGVQITEHALADGDIVHLGPVEYCFRASHVEHPHQPSRSAEATQALMRSVPHRIMRGTERLRELITMRAVDTAYQPIVDLTTGQVIGYEALARGRHLALTRSPAGLFALAEECGVAAELSQLCRELAVAQAADLPPAARLFLNLHPRELQDPGFVRSLEPLAAKERGRTLVFEIAEASVTNVADMGRIRDAFTGLNFEFAYDDFGAGQARFLELTEIPPHFLKLDMALIHGIEDLRPRQEVVKALLGAVKRFGVRVIAEGVETESCAAICRDLGCELGQGFLFGRPLPAGLQAGHMVASLP